MARRSLTPPLCILFLAAGVAPAPAADAPLPRGAVARLGSLQFRQTDAVRALAFSPDGKMLATDDGRTVYVWEAETGGLRHRLHRGDRGGPSCLAFSPDGKRLAVADSWWKEGKGSAFSLWDPATGEKVRHCWFGSKIATNIAALRYSPEGRTLLIDAGDGFLFDADTGELRRQLPNPGPRGSGGVLLWLPQRRLVTLRYWPGIPDVVAPQFDLVDFESKKPICRLENVQGVLYDAAVSRDGKSLALAVDAPEIRLYDLASGKLARTLSGHRRSVARVAFSPDGKLLASLGAEDGVRLWDLTLGKEAAHIPDGIADEWGGGLTFSPDGRTLVWASSWRRAPRFWDVRTGKEIVYPGHRGPASKLAFSPKGDVFTSLGADGSLIRWEFPSGRLIRQAEIAEDYLLDASLSPTGRGVFLTMRGRHWQGRTAVRVVDGKDGLLLKRPTVYRPQPAKAVRRPFGRRSPTKPPPLKQLQTCAVGISPDGSQFAVADAVSTERVDVGYRHSLKVRSFDVRTGRLRRVFHGRLPFLDGGPVRVRAALVYSPDGRWFAGGGERMCVWDAATGQPHPRAFARPADEDPTAWGFGASGTPLAFTPDSRALLWRSPDLQLHLTELLTGGEIACFGREWETVSGTFAPGGRILAVATVEGAVDLLDAATGERLHSLPKQDEMVEALAFSPDGKTLVTGCADTTLLAWDVSAVTGRKPPGKRLDPEEREKLFNSLGTQDADAADKAVWRLAADTEEAVRLVARRLRPVGSPAEERLRLERLVRQLDDDSFEDREEATRRLTELESAAEPALRAALKDTPSPEQRRRAEAILEEVKGKEGPSAAARWSARAVALLERIGDDEARKVLKALADGLPEAERTRDAQAALRRLGK